MKNVYFTLVIFYLGYLNFGRTESRCSTRHFGEDCRNDCHCKEQGTSTRRVCDHSNGSCLHGCSEGWQGENCQKRKLARNPRAFYKYYIWTREYNTHLIVDGRDDTCLNRAVVWIRVDLKSYVLVKSMRLYMSPSADLRAFEIYVGNSTRFSSVKSKSQLCYTYKENNLSEIDVQCNEVIRGRYVILLANDGTADLPQICELEVYGKLARNPRAFYKYYIWTREYDAHLIVDGRDDTCLNTAVDWIRVDLKSYGLVKSMRLYIIPRADLRAFEIYVGNSTDFSTLKSKSQLCYTYKGYNLSEIDVQCNEVIRGQYVILLGNDGTAELPQICELEVYECTDHFYGADCSQECGRCRIGCDHVSGECENGECEAGWRTGRCNETCDEGRYGPDCLIKCGACMGNRCDAKDGTCAYGCLPGYTGPLCEKRKTSNWFIIGITFIMLTLLLALAILTTKGRKIYAICKRRERSENGHENTEQVLNIYEIPDYPRNGRRESIRVYDCH